MALFTNNGDRTWKINPCKRDVELLAKGMVVIFRHGISLGTFRFRYEAEADGALRKLYSEPFELY